MCVPEAYRQIPRVKRTIEACRSLGVPVIYSAHNIASDCCADFYEFWDPIAAGAIKEGTTGADILNGTAGNDTINLTALFGPKMVYRNNLAFTAPGQVRINDVAGPDVIVEVNTGGTLAADFAIRLVGTTRASMTASDFVL